MMMIIIIIVSVSVIMSHKHAIICCVLLGASLSKHLIMSHYE